MAGLSMVAKSNDFWTDNLGYSAVAALVTVFLSVSPFVWAYAAYDRTAGVTAWANQSPIPRIEKFAHAFDQWLLIGLMLSVACALNWIEAFIDSTHSDRRGKYRLSWQANGATAFCFLGGIGVFLFGYISYSGSIQTIQKHIGYFEDELLRYFVGTMFVIFAYIISVIEIRRMKDRGR